MRTAKQSGCARSRAAISLSLLALALVAGAPAAAEEEAAETDPAGPVFTGLAASASAQLFTGAATTSIPIDLPPGRKNLTPNLALTYNSGGGPSPYGHGWSLPLGHIERSRRHGVLPCHDAVARRDFVVHLPGGRVECRLEEPVAGARLRCLPRVEEAFWRIFHTPAENRWDVWDRDGLHYAFGDSAVARTGTSTDTAWVDGQPCRYTQRWALTQTRDPNGNTVDITYEAEAGLLYPTRLAYGGHAEGLTPHLFEIVFHWRLRPQDARPFDASAGHPARLLRLLDRIDVAHPVGAAPVRSYGFRYDFDLAASAPGRRGLLEAVTVYGRNGTALARYDGLPASTLFRYRDAVPPNPGFTAPTATAVQLAPPHSHGALHEVDNGSSHSTTFVALRDMNGDGILDRVSSRTCQGGHPYWRVYLGSRDGFSETAIWLPRPSAASQACSISGTTRNGRTVRTQYDTVDINGDGIPDWIDASTEPWSVYLGRPLGDGPAQGFHPRVTWASPPTTAGAPAYALRISRDGYDWRDLIDWNGDGLLDVVDARTGRVHYNTGSGFDLAGVPIVLPETRLRRTHKGRLHEGLFDMNGDGLPDLVTSFSHPDGNYFAVMLHDGRGFGGPVEVWPVPATCAAGIRDKRGGDYTWRDLVDVNGDGLPDLVDTCRWSATSPYWDVYLNHGSGFATEPIAWASAVARLRHEQGTSTVRLLRDLVDGDGDGIPDLIEFGGDAGRQEIHRNRAGAFEFACDGHCLAPRTDAARPGALIAIENGVGASTHLAYLPSTIWDNTDAGGHPRLPAVLWTLTRVEQDSGVGAATPGSSSRHLDIRYAYGLFHPQTREFRGFGTVQSVEADGTTETTIFGQTRATAGRVLSVTTHAPGQAPDSAPPLRANIDIWHCFDGETGQSLGCVDDDSQPPSLGVRLRTQREFTYDAAGNARLAWREQLAWSAYGMPTHVRAGGSDTLAVDTFTLFAEANDLDGGGTTYNVAKPAYVRTVRSQTVEEHWMFYDGRDLGQVAAGNLSRSESWLDASVTTAPPCSAAPTKRCIATTMEYDGVGNVVAVTDPAGRVTTTAYGPDRIDPVRVTNPLGHTTHFGRDLACGRPLWQETANPGQRTTFVYDDFCRQIATILPGQTSASAQERITYYLGGPGVATNIFRRTAAPSSPTGWVETDDLFDGLGRRLQRQQVTTIDGSRVVLATDTVTYDERGLGVASRAPFPITQAFLHGSALYRPPPPGETTHFAYDPLGRLIHTRMPDGTERSGDFSVPWQSSAGGECYHRHDCAGTRTVLLADAHGNTVEKQILDEAGKPLLKTRYQHDFAGRVVMTEQWDGSRWQPSTRIHTEYDSLGRVRRIEDPDSGVWRFGYDLAGNLVYQDDPIRGRHVQLCYDELGRLSQKHVVQGTDEYTGPARCNDPGAAAEHYVYDDPSVPYGIGRLARVEDTSGSTRFLAYDVRGNAVAIEKGIVVGTYLESATTRYRYDRAGHLAAITYPDGDEVAYEYDEAGRVRSLRSVSDGTVYLADLTYDLRGRPRQITHGNGPFGIGVVDQREYRDANGGFRLARLTTVAPDSGAAPCGTGGRLLDLHYDTYTANGRIRSIRAESGSCGQLDASATYTYDALGRLTQVSGPQVHAQYEYDALGNMTGKDGRRFRYAKNRPHRLTHIDGAAVVAHDDNGNRTQKPGQVYRYDAEDRLVDINNGSVRIAYDHAGRQVRRSAGTMTTRYFDEFSEFRIEQGEPILTKHFFAGDLRIASRDVVWQPALAELDRESLFTLARASAATPWARQGLAALTSFGLIALMLLPDGRRRSRRVRRGSAIATLCLFLSGQLAAAAAPALVAPAWAGGGPGSTTVPLATVVAAPTPLRFVHYHVDHLGTPQVLTDAAGAVVEHLRYRPFGEVRGRWGADLRALGPARGFGFAGYENEPTSGLQYAGLRWYDADLGSFLTHDPARQYPNPYSYGGGDPINGVDRAGALFGLDDLLFAIVVGVVAGASGAGINAAIHGASLGEALKAAAIGGAIGGVSAWVGAGLVGPALSGALVPALTSQLVLAGVAAPNAVTIAAVAVYGSATATALATVGYQASRSNYGPLIGLGVAIGLNSAFAPPRPTQPQAGIRHFSLASNPRSGNLTVSDLMTGDVLVTNDGSMAKVTGHAAVVLDAEGDQVLVLSSDNRGIYTATNSDPQVGGRQWDVYRITGIDQQSLLDGVNAMEKFGGPLQYVDDRGGQVCSSTVAKAVERGGGPIAPRAFQNLVTPQALRNTYGPPIGRVFVPRLEGSLP